MFGPTSNNLPVPSLDVLITMDMYLKLMACTPKIVEFWMICGQHYFRKTQQPPDTKVANVEILGNASYIK